MSTVDSLEDSVIWLTGASRGIGRATARLLAQRGARLALAARETSHLEDVAEEVATVSGNAPLLLGYDVGDAAAVKAAAMRVRKELGGLDGLVNNAGVLDDAVLGMIKTESIQNTLGTNLGGVIHHMQFAARLMNDSVGGSIVNISSIVGLVGNAGQTVYSASKAGVIGATLSAAKELAARRIRVNAVAPGYIKTDMIAHLPPATHEARLSSVPLGRIGTPTDVAHTIVFLLSADAAYVTGQTLGVDGGMVL